MAGTVASRSGGGAAAGRSVAGGGGGGAASCGAVVEASAARRCCAPAEVGTRHPYVQSERAERGRVRQVYSVGVPKPTRVKVRSPAAWMARGRETELWESIDKAIARMVSKSSGRNEGEGEMASKCLAPEVEPSGDGRRQHGAAQMTEARRHSGGVVATARRQGCTEQLEKPSSSRAETRGAGTPHNRRHREIGRRREGDGWAGSSVEAG